jgi:hypothetical protein
MPEDFRPIFSRRHLLARPYFDMLCLAVAAATRDVKFAMVILLWGMLTSEHEEREKKDPKKP